MPVDATIESLPVVNKNIIRDHQEKFFSNLYPKERLRATTTSGSTGTPFTVYKDPRKLARHQEETVFFNERAGMQFGEELYYLRVWNSINRISPLKEFMTNIKMVDASNLNQKSSIAFIDKLCSSRSKKSLLGFSSAFTSLCNSISEDQIKALNLRTIVTMSEALPDATREQLKQLFGCPVISRYSNMENGFIAQQCGDDSGEYHVNIASFYVEILSLTEDKPVKNGELGRIVVTDLYNYGMPLLRYDTGDLGIMDSNSRCGAGALVLTQIGGRQSDFLINGNGELISPHTITNMMWKYKESLNQYQVIQNDIANFKVILNVKGEIDPAAALLEEFVALFGAGVSVAFEYVDQIPLLNSGKFRSVICNYKK